jgi:outer membrane protein assembly factor BamE
MKLSRTLFLMVACLLLTHCISYDLSRRVVQQGNLLPAATVARIKIGMSKQDVIQLLGSSLVHNIFDPNHLVYAYSLWKDGSPVRVKYISLTFQHNRLAHIDHNFHPRP